MYNDIRLLNKTACLRLTPGLCIHYYTKLDMHEIIMNPLDATVSHLAINSRCITKISFLFQERIAEMTLDKEYDVAVAGVKLVIAILRSVSHTLLTRAAIKPENMPRFLALEESTRTRLITSLSPTK